MTDMPSSRQIRPPIYSMKQTKLRRRRVVRYAILYFVLLVVILALIIGPAVAGKYIPTFKLSLLTDNHLVQPTGLSNDDTQGRNATGTGRVGYDGVLASAMSASAAAAKSTGKAAATTTKAAANRMMLLV